MASSDHELVALAQRGDPQAASARDAALEALYRRYAPRVWRYAWFRTHCREAAADIVQDTFLRLAQSIDAFRGDAAFATWLFTLTRSAAIDHARRNRRARDTTGDGVILKLVVEDGRVQQATPDSDGREAIRDAVARLPGAQRDAIVLYELSGMTVQQTAEVLGWTQSRVKVTLHRARRKLREMLVALTDAREATSRQGKC